MKKIDLVGKTFGKLKVICQVPSSNLQTRWKCRCECGNEKSIQGCHLRSGHTESCGCSWYRYGESHASWKGYKEISSRFFKSIMYNAIARKISFKIQIEDVWNLFLQQDRKCALSGLPLVFGAHNGKIQGTASLDRIDSSRGYAIDNVQWVHAKINSMKWNMPQEEFVSLCCRVCKHKSK